MSVEVTLYLALSAVRVSVAATGVCRMDIKAGGLVMWRRSMSLWKHTLMGPSYDDCRLMMHVAIFVRMLGTGVSCALIRSGSQ